MTFTGERVVPHDMHAHIPTLQEHLTRYVWALPFCAGAVTADCACGCGYGTSLIAQVAKWTRGYDIDEQTIHYARERYPDADFQVQDLSRGLGEVGTLRYRTIISFETIEHLREPETFIWSVSDWLLQDGLFVFSIPLNNPSQYHPHVYNFEQIGQLIGAVFPQIWWYRQDGMVITEGLPQSSTFALGVAKRARPGR